MEANRKISDSGYSLSCSNSTSQRSSKSQLNNGSNSSGSSGYCGKVTNDSNEIKCNKDSDHTSNSNNHALLKSEQESLDKTVEVETNSQQYSEQNVSAGGEINHNHAQEAKARTGTFSSEKLEPIQDGFRCIISMLDGVVLYTTPSLTRVLGFPKDLWLGHSFIDFVHPKDRETFSTQIIHLPVCHSFHHKEKETSTCSFYVSLRRHRDISSAGFEVVKNAVSYQAFHLTVNLQRAFALNATGVECPEAFLIVLALPMHSSYTMPCEEMETKTFGMRHTASCTFSHVDADVVTKLGFLPQDMIGKSVFDFYHPEDMPFLKQVYESVLNECQIVGTVYKSKPYRFAVKNGDFVKMETEWSCFINPWTHTLEFVIGFHKVLQGPENPNVFDDSPKSPKLDSNLSDHILEKAKISKEEILLLLSGKMLSANKIEKQDVSTNLMKKLIDDVSDNNNLPDDSVDNRNFSLSERNSVMLGEISPHHDYSDRESSETPPSYNQLNYNDNIQRFFESKPITTGGVRNHQIHPILNLQLEQKKNDSANLLPNRLFTNQHNGAPASERLYHPPPLTEELLYKHNEDMEEIMKQRHREQRFHIKKGKKTSHQTEGGGKNNTRQGVKRSVSTLWPTEHLKTSKNKYQNVGKVEKQVPLTKPTAKSKPNAFTGPITNDNTNVWPSFPLSVAPGMCPIYYIHNNTQPHPSTTTDIQLQYNMATNATVLNCKPTTTLLMSPIFCPPPTMVAVPVTTTTRATIGASQPAANHVTPSPSNEATNSENPSKDVITKPYNKTMIQVENVDNPKISDKGSSRSQDEESTTYSSFYSSFLKTDTDSSSNDDNSRGKNGNLYKKPLLTKPMRKCDPPWLETISMTPDLIYRYQVNVNNNSLEQILHSDSEVLKQMQQPTMVNEQLEQLYTDIELQGFATKLMLDEESSSTSGSSEEVTDTANVPQKMRQSFSSLVMIYEEDAHLPPPEPKYT